MGPYVLRLICISFLACGGTAKSSESPRADSAGLSEGETNFIERFLEEEQLLHYVAEIDALIDAADAAASMNINAEGSRPSTTTNNGVFVVASLTNTPDFSVYHFSFSRRPYLASSLAHKFAALIAIRMGFPIPSAIEVSQNQVFHLDWSLPNNTNIRNEVAAVRQNIRSRDIDAPKLQVRLLLETAGMESKAIKVPKGK